VIRLFINDQSKQSLFARVPIFSLKKNSKVIDNVILVSQLGLTMVGSILFCFYLGYLLDRWLDTSGLFITIFILLGVAGGGYTAYRQIMEADLTNDKKK
jgi:ATP synthase protein I